MGLSIRIRCRYGFAFSAHFGTTLSRIDGGACGRSDGAGVSSSEVNPGGGVGGCESDELKRIDARGVASSRLLEHMLVALRGALARNTHLWVPLPSIGSMLDARMMSSAGWIRCYGGRSGNLGDEFDAIVPDKSELPNWEMCTRVARIASPRHRTVTHSLLAPSTSSPSSHITILHPPLYHRPARTTDREALGSY